MAKSLKVKKKTASKTVLTRRVGSKVPVYQALLKSDRLRESTRGDMTIFQAVESDRARVIYSSAFRRLQGKTQVFPLDENAAVRTRLTHSLEVAHVGRFLTTSVVEEMGRENLLSRLGIVDSYRAAFTVVTETACLLHDIGNPPFGHFGEGVIAKWFEITRAFPSTEIEKQVRESPEFMDLLQFDGNSQGFRIATRLGGIDAFSGLNLTVTQLAAMLKYSCTSSERPGIPALKKCGVFETEADFLEKIRSVLRLSKGQRFPLAYLMEAADDISYSLSDIEDGIENGILEHSEAVEGLIAACGKDAEAKQIILDAKKKMEDSPSIDPVVSFRSALIRTLVSAVARQYVRRHDEILDGSINELISTESVHGRVLDFVKTFARQTVYDDSIPRGLELSGAAALRGILDKYAQLLSLSRSEFNSVKAGGKKAKAFGEQSRLFTLIAPRHRDVYSACVDEKTTDAHEWCLRAHMIVDFVSGMTDQFALTCYQRLSGIRL